MLSLTEKQRVKKLIDYFKKRYPKAVKDKKDRNLLGRFLEVLTHVALNYAGYYVYDFTATAGDRGIDLKLLDDRFFNPVCFAIECMNGNYDYTETYFKYLKHRITDAYSEQHNPIIICVNRKKNFERFKGKFVCNVDFIELGKQYHPNTTTFKDYLRLKKQLTDTIEKIVESERPEEIEELKEQEAEAQAMEKWDEEDSERWLEQS